jgi:hypothetical protein
MRRLSFKRQTRFVRLARVRDHRRRGRAKRRHERAQATWVPNGAAADALETKSATWRGSNYAVPVTGQGRAVPETLCLEKNRDETLTFVANVRAGLEAAGSRSTNKAARRRASKSPPQRIGSYWDMSCVREISPAVALMLAAEFERVRDHTGWSPSAIDVKKWDPHVFNLLEEIGFFRLLDIRRSPSIGSLSPSIIALKFRSDKRAVSTVTGKLIEDLEEVANRCFPSSSVDFDLLMGAVLEGITNTKQHAYPDELLSSFRFSPRWWATGAVDTAQRCISTIIYDQGATIPATIQVKSVWSEFTAALRNLTNRAAVDADDGALIAAAMEVGRSKTQEAHRGKGLGQMEQVMSTCSRGRLRVFSRYGEYVSYANGETSQFTHDMPIRGTLVQWDVWV